MFRGVRGSGRRRGGPPWRQTRSSGSTNPCPIASSGRAGFGRPLTLAEKILVSHADDFDKQEWSRGKAQLRLRVDRVALQDATGQMALLQFMQAGRSRWRCRAPCTATTSSARRAGPRTDMERALAENREVYDFLHSASKKYGIGFWKPGAGIIHQVVLENYAFPGGLMIGADSHTPNAGGLGMVAIGVGGADAVEAMAGLAWEVLDPKLIGIRLTGKLSGWTSAKDVITVALSASSPSRAAPTRSSSTSGPARSRSAPPARAPSATWAPSWGRPPRSSTFDDRMAAYLRATDRADDQPRSPRQYRAAPGGGPGGAARIPKKHFDEVVEINLSELEPHIVGPHSPDRARPMLSLAAEVEGRVAHQHQGRPHRLAAPTPPTRTCARAAHIATQALKAGLKRQDPFLRHPGLRAHLPDRSSATASWRTFEQIGGTVLANACGPCIGQWKRSRRGHERGQHHRVLVQPQLPGRNDGSAATHVLPDQPRDRDRHGLRRARWSSTRSNGTMPGPTARPFRFTAPEGGGAAARRASPGARRARGPRRRRRPRARSGSRPTASGSSSSSRSRGGTAETSTELPHPGEDQGQDHHRPHLARGDAGSAYRGHLDKISDNMFLGAVNAFTGEAGKGVNPDYRRGRQDLHRRSRATSRREGTSWIVIGDENYGEGSSREHAAMSPRYLGAKVVIVKSFARIHETNLKKQGILP